MINDVTGKLTGKTALVTGGASGFGAGIVRRFILEGAQVASVDRNLEAAQALCAELGEAAWALRADLTITREVAEVAQTVLTRWGHLDILVNNAGLGQPPQFLEELSEAEFDRIILVNAKSIYLTAKSFVPRMKQLSRGVILNVASTGAVRPRPKFTWYNASKGWVVGATRAMAIELAPFGIRVNAINPVAGDTPMLATFMGGNSQESRAKMVATIPLGRLCTAADIGAAAAYLCSDDASMVTGVAMEVDGGRCL
jgi:3-oxoacyl-[acyl-carrier protein] reductase